MRGPPARTFTQHWRAGNVGNEADWSDLWPHRGGVSACEFWWDGGSRVRWSWLSGCTVVRKVSHESLPGVAKVGKHDVVGSRAGHQRQPRGRHQQTFGRGNAGIFKTGRYVDLCVYLVRTQSSDLQPICYHQTFVQIGNCVLQFG